MLKYMMENKRILRISRNPHLAPKEATPDLFTQREVHFPYHSAYDEVNDPHQ
jgi:hypothetical protein